MSHVRSPVDRETWGKKIHHFAHASGALCVDRKEKNSNGMTEWHKSFQMLCRPDAIEVPLFGETRAMRADIHDAIDDTVVEIQHSQICPNTISSREHFYVDELGKNLTWIVDATRNNATFCAQLTDEEEGHKTFIVRIDGLSWIAHISDRSTLMIDTGKGLFYATKLAKGHYYCEEVDAQVMMKNVLKDAEIYPYKDVVFAPPLVDCGLTYNQSQKIFRQKESTTTSRAVVRLISSIGLEIGRSLEEAKSVGVIDLDADVCTKTTPTVDQPQPKTIPIQPNLRPKTFSVQPKTSSYSPVTEYGQYWCYVPLRRVSDMRIVQSVASKVTNWSPRVADYTIKHQKIELKPHGLAFKWYFLLIPSDQNRLNKFIDRFPSLSHVKTDARWLGATLLFDFAFAEREKLECAIVLKNRAGSAIGHYKGAAIFHSTYKNVASTQDAKASLEGLLKPWCAPCMNIGLAYLASIFGHVHSSQELLAEASKQLQTLTVEDPTDQNERLTT